MFHFSQVYFCNTYLFNSFAVETALPAHAASSYIMLLESMLKKKKKSGPRWCKVFVEVFNLTHKQSQGAIPQARIPPCLRQPSHTSDLSAHPPTCCFPRLWLHVSFARTKFWILQAGSRCAADPILPTAPSSPLGPLPRALGSGCAAPPKPAAQQQPHGRQLFWENHP